MQNKERTSTLFLQKKKNPYSLGVTTVDTGFAVVLGCPYKDVDSCLPLLVFWFFVDPYKEAHTSKKGCKFQVRNLSSLISFSARNGCEGYNGEIPREILLPPVFFSASLFLLILVSLYEHLKSLLFRGFKLRYLS